MGASRALRLLLFLKLKGGFRKQLRRLKRPSGMIFALFGVVIMFFWFGSLIMGASVRGRLFEGENLDLMVRVACLALFVMTVTASFNHRGVYLPTEELERLLASPATRSDLVRYRLIASTGRYLFSGIIFGLVTVSRLPNPLFGFIGVVLAMLTLPIVGQLSSLAFGALEIRFGGVFSKGRFPFLRAFAGGLMAIIFMTFLFGDEIADHFSSVDDIRSFSESLATETWVKVILMPFHPWTAMITAPNISAFLPWLATCLVLWIVFFESTARMPVDFRELALETSASVAKRIRNVQRGGFGASAGKAKLSTFGRRIPWVFGRGPFGAMAWIKLSSILRKTRGTLTISSLIIALLTIASIVLFPEPVLEDIVRGAAIVAGFGTIYLCAGLRFDFRTDLDRMEAIKSWPLAPSRAFFANLLPEVLLVSLLLSISVGIRVAITGGFHPVLFAVLAGIPLVALGWVALDNAVFLFAPVRYVAGQEGMLQHMGRSMILLFLRGLITFAVVALAGGVGVGIWFLAEPLEETVRVVCVSLAVGAMLLLVDAALIVFGGMMLRRFDVSRIPK